jgi:hypothetical protein
MDHSITSFHTNYKKRDHLSCQTSSNFTRPCLAAQDYNLQGSISSQRMLSGSIDELRSSSFVAAANRTFSFAGTFPGRSSLANLDQRPSPAPAARSLALYDVEDVRSLNQLHQEPYFVDMPNGHQINFIFPPAAAKSTTQVVPHSLHNLKTKSYHKIRQNQTLPLIIRSTSMKEPLERGNYGRKVPLYTPSQIIRRTGTPASFPGRTSSLPNGDAVLQAGDGTEDEIFETRDRSSTNSLSNSSTWSTKEDRAHGQDPDAPSLRSEDPSVKSGYVGPWWKGQGLVAAARKMILRRPAVETIDASESGTESNNFKEQVKRSWGYYARRMKHKP